MFPYKPAKSKIKRNRNARPGQRFLRDLPALGLRPGTGGRFGVGARSEWPGILAAGNDSGPGSGREWSLSAPFPGWRVTAGPVTLPHNPELPGGVSRPAQGSGMFTQRPSTKARFLSHFSNQHFLFFFKFQSINVSGQERCQGPARVRGKTSLLPCCNTAPAQSATARHSRPRGPAVPPWSWSHLWAGEAQGTQVSGRRRLTVLLPGCINALSQQPGRHL